MRYPVKDDENDKVAIIGSLGYIKKAMDMEKLEYQCSIIPEITTITPTTKISTVKILKPAATDSENGASTTTEKEFLTDELKTEITVNVFLVINLFVFCLCVQSQLLFWVEFLFLKNSRSHLIFCRNCKKVHKKRHINHKHALFIIFNTKIGRR